MFCCHFAKLSHKTIIVGWVVHILRMLFIICLFYATDARHQDIMLMSIHPSRIWVLLNTLGGRYGKNCNGMKQEHVFRCYKYESRGLRVPFITTNTRYIMSCHLPFLFDRPIMCKIVEYIDQSENNFCCVLGIKKAVSYLIGRFKI